MDRLYQDLTKNEKSVHLALFPKYDQNFIKPELEGEMQLAQRLSSSILSLRKKEKIRVRQPLESALIATSQKTIKNKVLNAREIILNETNLKNLRVIDEDSELVSKKAKANFKILGPKYGSKIKDINEKISLLDKMQIKQLEEDKEISIGDGIVLTKNDVEIVSQDIQGYSVAVNTDFTVALDIQISDDLKSEGLAREFVNRIQNLRKEKKYLVTDKISILIEKNEKVESAFQNNLNYICNETLADNLSFSSSKLENFEQLGLVDDIICNVLIEKK